MASVTDESVRRFLEGHRVCAHFDLHYHGTTMKLPPDPATRTELMEAYLRLMPFPDVNKTVSSLSGMRFS